jgi:hypothetical protein
MGGIGHREGRATGGRLVRPPGHTRQGENRALPRMPRPPTDNRHRFGVNVLGLGRRTHTLSGLKTARKMTAARANPLEASWKPQPPGSDVQRSGARRRNRDLGRRNPWIRPAAPRPCTPLVMKGSPVRVRASAWGAPAGYATAHLAAMSCRERRCWVVVDAAQRRGASDRS